MTHGPEETTTEEVAKFGWVKYPLIFLVGFLFYPGLFVPLSFILAPRFTEWWILVYAEYLEHIWGF